MDKIRSLLLVGAVWMAIYIPFLGSRELQGNEARRILPALSMLSSGDWIRPELANQPYYKKPPLINWMIAASFSIFDSDSEAAARIISSIFTLLFCVFLILSPSDWMDLRTKTLGALFYLTSYGVIINGRLIEIEAPLAALTGMATIFWLDLFSKNPDRKWTLWIPVSVILGLGLLLKGPIILLFFYATTISVLFTTRKMKSMLSPAHFVSILIMVGIFMLWALKIKSLLPPEAEGTISRTWRAELLDELSPASIDYSYWGQVILTAVSYFLPWVLLLPLLRRKKTGDNCEADFSGKMLAGAFFSLILGFILVNAMPGTEPRYSVPLLPLAAVLSAVAVRRIKFSIPVEKCRKSIILGAWILAFLCAVAFAVTEFGIVQKILLSSKAVRARTVFEFVPANFTVSLILLIAVFLAPILMSRMKHMIKDAMSLAGAASILIAQSMFLVFVVYTPTENTMAKKRFLAFELEKTLPPGAMLNLLDISYQPYLYYIRDPKKCIYSFDSIAGAEGFVLMNRQSYDDMVDSMKRNPAFLRGFKFREIRSFKYKRNEYDLIEIIGKKGVLE